MTKRWQIHTPDPQDFDGFTWLGTLLLLFLIMAVSGIVVWQLLLIFMVVAPVVMLLHHQESARNTRHNKRRNKRHNSKQHTSDNDIIIQIHDLDAALEVDTEVDPLSRSAFYNVPSDKSIIQVNSP